MRSGLDLLHLLQRRAVQPGQGAPRLRLRQVHLQGKDLKTLDWTAMYM